MKYFVSSTFSFGGLIMCVALSACKSTCVNNPTASQQTQSSIGIVTPSSQQCSDAGSGPTDDPTQPEPDDNNVLINPTTVPIVLKQLSPAAGEIVGGFQVEVQGSGLKRNSEIYIGGKLCSSYVFRGSSLANCLVPGGADLGPVDVEIFDQAGGTKYLFKKAFVYADTKDIPVITSVSPSVISSMGGTVITISGSGFALGMSVKIDNFECSNVSVGGFSASCTVPAGIPGAATLRVQNPATGGQFGVLAEKANALTYSGSPSYKTLKERLFSQSCVSCHGGNNGINNTSYASLTTGAHMALPADLNNSQAVINFMNQNQGALFTRLNVLRYDPKRLQVTPRPMPFGGLGDDRMIKAVNLWIQSGAPNPTNEP